MFLLVIELCLYVVYGAESSGDETVTEIDTFELYAGNLTYSNNQDGSCIACDVKNATSCTRANAVSPHSWTAKLEYYKNDTGTYVYKDRQTCEQYAHDVKSLGVVAFTWRNSTHSCSLHVRNSIEDIGTAMVIYNGFTWTRENPENTGPLYLVSYPTMDLEVDAVCYYGLNINSTPNITFISNILILLFVLFVITAWNVWMYHTDNYPPKDFDDLVERRSSIYTEEPHAKKH
jgi:hypothetical protein